MSFGTWGYLRYARGRDVVPGLCGRAQSPRGHEEPWQVAAWPFLPRRHWGWPLAPGMASLGRGERQLCSPARSIAWPARSAREPAAHRVPLVLGSPRVGWFRQTPDPEREGARSGRAEPQLCWGGTIRAPRGGWGAGAWDAAWDLEAGSAAAAGPVTNVSCKPRPCASASAPSAPCNTVGCFS